MSQVSLEVVGFSALHRTDVQRSTGSETYIVCLQVLYTTNPPPTEDGGGGSQLLWIQHLKASREEFYGVSQATAGSPFPPHVYRGLLPSQPSSGLPTLGKLSSILTEPTVWLQVIPPPPLLRRGCSV